MGTHGSVAAYFRFNHRGSKIRSAGHADIRGACVDLLEMRRLFSSFTVTSLADDGGDNELRWAVDQANAAGDGSLINFSPGLSGTISITGTLEFQTSIQLQGPGAKLLTVNGPIQCDAGVTTSIADLTLTGSGQKIFNLGSSLTLTACSISGNTAPGDSGGALFNDQNCTAVISQCSFSNDYAGYGGAIYNDGTLTITNSQFSDDSAGYGGAIYCNSGSGIVSITSCAFTSNSAASDGGALDVQEGQVSVVSSTFSGNSADDGGAFYISGASVDIQYSLLQDNTAEFQGQGSGGAIYNAGALTIENSTLSSNVADFDGGAIDDWGTATTTSCSFTGNTGTTVDYAGGGGGGGAVTAFGAYNSANSTYSSNFSYASGGAILSSSGNSGGQDFFGKVTLTNCTVYSNGALGSGGGIYNNYSVTLKNSIVAGSSVPLGREDLAGSNLTSSSGHNLIGDGSGGVNNGSLLGTSASPINPLLAKLGYFGGFTQCMPPLPGSPAINAGSNSLKAGNFDQRGFSRVAGSSVDIGAVETGGFTLTAAASSTPQTARAGAAFAHSLAVTVAAINGIDPVAGGLVNFSATPGAAGQSATVAASAVISSAGVASVAATANTKVGAYTVTGKSAGASALFSLTNIASTTHLVIHQQPASTIAGKAIAPAIVVYLEDAFGNIVTTDTSSVKLSIASGPAGAALTGTVTAAAKAGSATFSKVILTKAGSAYTLKATDGSLTAATTRPFSVTAGSATHIAFASAIPKVTAGKVISPAVVVDVEDVYGNVVTTNTSNVTLTIEGGATGATLGGTKTVAAKAGAATFSNLVLTKASSGYALGATDGSFASVISTSFSVSAGTPTKLVFQNPTGTGHVGKAISPAVTVNVEDAFGNIVVIDGSQITVSIASGPGGTLSGVVSVDASAGVSIFSDLLLSKTGKYTLKAADGKLTSAVSGNFTVS